MLTFFCTNGIICAMKEKNNYEIEFHRYGLRVPEELYKLIEDMAWDSRTSVNIKIMDMIFYAFYLIFQDTYLQIDPESYILKLKDRDKERFKKLDKEDQRSFIKRIKTIRKKYEEWRNAQ